MPGSRIRSDIVDVYIFRQSSQDISDDRPDYEFLQMRRTGSYQTGCWHPVMGHVEDDETAVQTALRELAEETGYTRKRSLIHLWQLEPVNTYYLARYDCIVMSPCFAAQVKPDSQPQLDHSHDASRWIPLTEAKQSFLWPGQRTAIDSIITDIIPALSNTEQIAEMSVESMLRIDLDAIDAP